MVFIMALSIVCITPSTDVYAKTTEKTYYMKGSLSSDGDAQYAMCQAIKNGKKSKKKKKKTYWTTQMYNGDKCYKFVYWDDKAEVRHIVYAHPSAFTSLNKKVHKSSLNFLSNKMTNTYNSSFVQKIPKGKEYKKWTDSIYTEFTSYYNEASAWKDRDSNDYSVTMIHTAAQICEEGADGYYIRLQPAGRYCFTITPYKYLITYDGYDKDLLCEQKFNIKFEIANVGEKIQYFKTLYIKGNAYKKDKKTPTKDVLQYVATTLWKNRSLDPSSFAKGVAKSVLQDALKVNAGEDISTQIYSLNAGKKKAYGVKYEAAFSMRKTNNYTQLLVTTNLCGEELHLAKYRVTITKKK